MPDGQTTTTTTTPSTKVGYVNGSDMLIYVGTKAIGHCTTHTTTFNSETKERAVKPAATQVIGNGLWKQKGVVGLSYSISAEGLCFYSETEYGFKDLLAAWKAGTAVTVKCMERAGDSTETPDPYLEGSVIITNLERTDPAQDDSTYSVQLENNGAPTTLDDTKFT